MAFIPDEAVDSFDELTKGARLYYVWLCRVRNQKTGRCFPSVSLTMESLGINRGSVYALRKELQAKSWASFDGSEARLIKGFESPKNQTVSEEITEDASNSLKNQTIPPESLKNQTPSLKNQTVCLKNQTKESEKSDSLYKELPANITSKYNHTSQPSASREPDPFFDRFIAAYETAYGCPYQHKKADFVQLANCRKQGGEWLTLDRWQIGVDHYFVSEIGSHTLADLASRFGAFFRSSLDRYGKAIQNGNIVHLTPKTQGNIAAAQSFIASMEGYFDAKK